MTYLSATIAALGIGLLPLATLPTAAAAQESDTPAAGETASEAVVEEMQIGNPDADVTVVEYASFTCPHCRDFHDTVFERLKADYIDPGKINFVYREVYFDRYGLWAGMVARCGGPEKYFGIADLLYDRQRDWVQGEPAQIAGNLRRIGKSAGLTDDQLESCLGDADKAEALLAAYEANAEADEIESTPSFVINGTRYSNMGYDEFSSILDEKLAE